MNSQTKCLPMALVLLIIVGALHLATDRVLAASKGTLKAAIHFAPSRDWMDPGIAALKVSGHFVPYMFHDALMKPMPGNAHTPCLAESWTHSPDYRVWEFKIRKGVKFHNGDEVTAEDAVFTFKRYKGGGSKLLQSKFEKLEAVDKYLFRVTFKEPFLDFLDFFLPGGSTIGWIVPKKYIEKVGYEGFRKHPIGAGPYKFVEFTPGQRIVGEAFEGYWRKIPKVKRLEVYMVKEGATRYSMVKTGEVDIATLMIDVFYKKVKEDPNLKVGVPLSASTYYIAYSQQWDPKSPWADIRVRRAASFAIDRQSLVDVHSPGSHPMGTIGLKDDPNTLPNPPAPYDPKRAKQLLAEAGYPDGFDGGKFYVRNGPYWAYGEQVINYWRAVGIKVKGVFLDKAAQAAQRRAGKFKDGNHIDSAAGATVRGRMFYSLNPLYYRGDPDIDRLWKRHNESLDAVERMNLLMRIQKIIYDKEIFTPLTQLNSPAAYAPRVKGNPWKTMSPYPVWLFVPMEDLELNE